SAVLLEGDMVRITGAAGDLVYDVTADVDADALGAATLPLYPPILTAPADAAVIDVTAPIRARIVRATLPETDRFSVVVGIELEWEEVPA
ncbi:MAG: hypothetical protein RQ723_12640, partial [Desulfuromonadales bacterium]|nr:hypothetical protein [Desulfuromonadales bacterium]